MDTVFAGLDWASRTHAVCVIDERGGVCKQWDVSHDADGLRELMRQLHALHVTHIAIERPSGLLVDALMQASFKVVAIHPNAVKASRPRYRSHGGKSDASDAYLLADLLRTDGHRFKPIAALYKKHGEALGIRWDYAFYQMVLETNHLMFNGDVRARQNNFAGIGASDSRRHWLAILRRCRQSHAVRELPPREPN